MKKILLVIPVFVLMANGCNWFNQTQDAKIPSSQNIASNQTENFVWKNFSSKYFNLSFEYPDGYEVIDSQNEVKIAKGKYQNYEIGRDNAFLRINRYSNDLTYANQNKVYGDEVKSNVVIDGTTFIAYTSEDTGSCEGSSYGKVTRILFEKSVLSMQQYECGQAGQDFTNVQQHILETLKF